MSNEILKRDENHISVLGGVTNDENQDVTMLRVDPTTKRLLITTDTNPFSFLTIVGYSDADYIVPTDSTTADIQINAAMLQASLSGGGLVFLKPGTYIISDILQIPSGVSLVGSGIDSTIIKAVNGYAPATRIYGSSTQFRVMLITYNSQPISHSSVSGITWDLNVQNQPGLVDNTGHRAVWIKGATDFRFIGNKGINGINWTFFFNLVDELWIQNNIILGGYSSTYTQNDGIHVRNCTHFYIQNNYIDTSVGGGTSGDDCIAIGSDTDATADTAYGVVTGNHINASKQRGIITVLGGTYNIRNIVIANNVVENTQQAGIKLYTAPSQTGINDTITVSNNIFYNIAISGTDGPYGIALAGDGGTPRQVHKNYVISNNQIKHLVSGSGTGYGMYITGQATDVVLEGNNLTDLLTGVIVGFRVGGTNNAVSNIIINNNHIDISGGGAAAKGMQLYNTSYGTVNGNMLIGTANNSGNGIEVTGAASGGHLTLTGNTVRTFNVGLIEVNGGVAPNYDMFIGNNTTNVTTAITTVGAQSLAPAGTNLNG